MKWFTQELMSMLTVVAISVAVVLAFPFDAVGFRPRAVRAVQSASAAFVSMTAEEQAAAMQSARTAWQVDSVGVRRLRVDLSVGELPEDPSTTALKVGLKPVRSGLKPVGYEPCAYPRTQAAATAVPIAKPKDEPETRPPFPREDLLKLD